ncbi:RNA 2',3'-cyclic phosphodiesterase [Rossellomorea sp. FM04394]|uniref:RNA 2',3'-cyclic phosphodiesterase n=1 Tax=Rossellomorea sp. FM04394 TaxID=3243076 RepID=UPI0035A57D59
MLKAHYFFALSLSQETKRHIQKWTQPMKDENFFKNWVHPQDYHLTLAFLGSADELQPVIHKVEALECSAFPLTLDHFGIFGKSDSPRILWMGIQPSEALQRVRDRVYDSCEEAGFQLDKRPFSPHITVGRKWNKAFPFTTEWLNAFQPTHTHSFTAVEIVLYQTHLDRLPKYEAIYTKSLQANRPS